MATIDVDNYFSIGAVVSAESIMFALAELTPSELYEFLVKLDSYLADWDYSRSFIEFGEKLKAEAERAGAEQ